MSSIERRPGRRPRGMAERVNLSLPAPLNAELEELSRELGLSKGELMRGLLVFGLKLFQLAKGPDSAVYFQEEGEEKPRRVFPLL